MRTIPRREPFSHTGRHKLEKGVSWCVTGRSLPLGKPDADWYTPFILAKKCGGAGAKFSKITVLVHMGYFGRLFSIKRYKIAKHLETDARHRLHSHVLVLTHFTTHETYFELHGRDLANVSLQCSFRLRSNSSPQCALGPSITSPHLEPP